MRFSFQYDISDQLGDKLWEVDLSEVTSMELYDLSDENGLDTYMSIEVLVPKGDEARSLTQEELGQGQRRSWLIQSWINLYYNCIP